MPIYAYKCSSCGHGADVMQKLAEAPLTVCPACGQPNFTKQITAAGFQLKGSGWYATDFKNGSKGAKKEASETGSGDKAEPATGGKSAPATGEKSATATSEKSQTATGARPAPDASRAGPAPKGGSGGSGACS